MITAVWGIHSGRATYVVEISARKFRSDHDRDGILSMVLLLMDQRRDLGSYPRELRALPASSWDPSADLRHNFVCVQMPGMNDGLHKRYWYCITYFSLHRCHQVGLRYRDRNQLNPLEKEKSMVDFGVCFDSNLIFRDHILKSQSLQCTWYY